MIITVTAVVCGLLFLVGAASLVLAWIGQERKTLRWTVATALSMLVVSVTGMILHLMSAFQEVSTASPEVKQAVLASGIDGFDLPGLFATAGWISLLLVAGVLWVWFKGAEADEGE